MKLYGVKHNGQLMKDDEGHPVLTESENQSRLFLDSLRTVTKIMKKQDEYELVTFREDIAPNPYLFTVHCRNDTPKRHKGYRIWARTKEDVINYIKYIGLNEEDGDWKVVEEEPPADAYLLMVGYRVRHDGQGDGEAFDKPVIHEGAPAVFRRHSDAQCFINTQNTDKLYIQVDLVSDASIRKEYQ